MEDTEETRRIWAIRDHIDELEKVKDQILELPDIDSMWVSDTKDLHFHIVSSWELLKSCPRLEGEKREERARNSMNYLELAKDKFVQVSSELDALSSEAQQLSKQLDEMFNLAAKAIEESLSQYLLASEETAPDQVVRLVGEADYAIYCAVCGKVCGVFANGEKDDGSKWILFEGITTSTTLRLDLNKEIFEYLRQGSLQDVHKHLSDRTFLEDGLDSYCPECDKPYCRTHYSPRVVYDEGFYDCTYGTCPEGHERIIDD